MSVTKIEWTEVTWNPTSGCSKISLGCRNCYAERMAIRLRSMGSEKYINGFDFTLHPEIINEPFTWNKPRLVFVNSMSDLFHENMPLWFLKEIFRVMNENTQHTFQLLTKRVDSLLKYNSLFDWTDNIWMGVTVECSNYLERINLLKQTNARVKFISMEPLLSPIVGQDFDGIDWVIVGGESGPNARILKKEWVLSIRNQCIKQNVPFFFKQWGGTNKKKAGRLLDGRIWNEMPVKAIKPSVMAL
jgi:protein gp37